MARLLLQLVGCFALVMPCAATADWVLDAAGGITFDDNLPNALAEADRKADSALSAALRAGIYQQLGVGTGLSLNLLAEQTSYVRYSGLTNLGAGASVRLRHKFWFGSDAAWVALSAQTLHRDYRYDYRDGWQYDASLAIGKPLTARWNAQGSVRYDRYTADHLQAPVLPGISTAAYDTWGWNFGAQTTYALTHSDLLSAGYTWRNGTVTAITPRNKEILEYSSAVARDPVFGTTPRRVAYRFWGQAEVLSLAWSHAFGAHSAVTLSYVYRNTRAAEIGDYYSNVISLFLAYSR